MTPFQKKKKKNFLKFLKRRPGMPSKHLGGPPLFGPAAKFGDCNGVSPICAERVPAKRYCKNLETGTL